MEELFSKLVLSILGQTNSSVVTILLLVIGYLAWKSWNDSKDHKAELKEHRETIQHLQDAINTKIGEERRALLDIIDKYHDSQGDIKGALTEIRTVLLTQLK